MLMRLRWWVMQMVFPPTKPLGSLAWGFGDSREKKQFTVWTWFKKIPSDYGYLFIWLVVEPTPSEEYMSFVSWDDYIPLFPMYWKNKNVSKPPNQIM